MIHTIRITFGTQAQPQIDIQQGDYNSRTIQALCYTSSGGAMSFDGQTVSVVYSISGTVSAEYPVQVTGNVLSFTMPGFASASVGAGSMQVRIYGSKSLLQSAIIPFVVKASLDPGPAEEDQVPMLAMLVQQAQQAIAGANAAASTANQVAQIANTAANLASEKAGLAQNAASSANEAATNATNSAELAQTAADNANSASASANSAAGTANNAAANANSAAESANNAATNANQVADEIKQKADSGAFNGKDGLNAPQIDDTQITTTNPWSSMQIVKTLCPPFSATGSVVQCYPVANYPLGVQASWEPRQEGEGEPSPENVRPITGMDEVKVARCGKNVLDTSGAYRNAYNYVLPNARLIAGAKYTYTVPNLIASGEGAALFVIADDYKLTDYIGSGESYTFTVPENLDFSQGLWIAGGSASALDNVPAESFMVELGTTPTSYAPYTGTTHTLTLPETIYGGTVDAVTGEGSEEWSSVNLSSSNNLGILEDYTNETTMLYYVGTLNNMQDATLVCCSHLPTANIVNSINTNIGIIGNPAGDMAYIRLSKETAGNLDEFRQWVDAQAAAGTPVTIVYKLATPNPIQATGGQSLPALPGTNTVYTDADSVTVTGRADPVQTINALNDRIAALESAALS